MRSVGEATNEWRFLGALVHLRYKTDSSRRSTRFRKASDWIERNRKRSEEIVGMKKAVPRSEGEDFSKIGIQPRRRSRMKDVGIREYE